MTEEELKKLAELLSENLIEKMRADNWFPPRMLTTGETARYLGYERKTFYNKKSAGKLPIPCKRIGGRPMFDRRDIDQYLDSLNGK